MNSPTNILHGVTVMVTRPKQLADNLARLVEKNGGRSFLDPVICIEEPDNASHRDQLLKKLSSFDIAIFISPTAVQKAFEHINSFPDNTQIAVIGSSTQSALKNLGIHASIVPAGHDSEALLRHPALQSTQLAGKSIVIFRGQGGRELLGDTLVSRGATVSYAEIYKRVRNERLPSLSTTELHTIDIVAVTSNEGLQNLYDLTGEKGLLLEMPLLVPGKRTQQLAEKLGFSNITRAENATDVACIEALQRWSAGR